MHCKEEHCNKHISIDIMYCKIANILIIFAKVRYQYQYLHNNCIKPPITINNIEVDMPRSPTPRFVSAATKAHTPLTPKPIHSE